MSGRLLMGIAALCLVASDASAQAMAVGRLDPGSTPRGPAPAAGTGYVPPSPTGDISPSYSAATSADPSGDPATAAEAGLSCQALNAELLVATNDIQRLQGAMAANAQQLRRNAATVSPHLGGGALAASAQGLVASMIPGAGLALGAVQAAQSARNLGLNRQMAGADNSIAALTEASERAGRLAQLSATKGC